jgi:hypothetical protein
MVVEIDFTTSPPAVALLEADDLRALKVLARGLDEDRARLADALAPVGLLADSGDALLDVHALQRLAGPRAGDEQWLEQFDAMVAYARSKGWVSSDGQRLQAHCEWQASRRASA